MGQREYVQSKINTIRFIMEYIFVLYIDRDKAFGSVIKKLYDIYVVCSW
jgi:hypothetical protein